MREFDKLEVRALQRPLDTPGAVTEATVSPPRKLKESKESNRRFGSETFEPKELPRQAGASTSGEDTVQPKAVFKTPLRKAKAPAQDRDSEPNPEQETPAAPTTPRKSRKLKELEELVREKNKLEERDLKRKRKAGLLKTHDGTGGQEPDGVAEGIAVSKSRELTKDGVGKKTVEQELASDTTPARKRSKKTDSRISKPDEDQVTDVGQKEVEEADQEEQKNTKESNAQAQRQSQKSRMTKELEELVRENETIERRELWRTRRIPAKQISKLRETMSKSEPSGDRSATVSPTAPSAQVSRANRTNRNVSEPRPTKKEPECASETTHAETADEASASGPNEGARTKPRRVKAEVKSFAEPSLRYKLRQGDPGTFDENRKRSFVKQAQPPGAQATPRKKKKPKVAKPQPQAIEAVPIDDAKENQPPNIPTPKKKEEVEKIVVAKQQKVQPKRSETDSERNTQAARLSSSGEGPAESPKNPPTPKILIPAQTPKSPGRQRYILDIIASPTTPPRSTAFATSALSPVPLPVPDSPTDNNNRASFAQKPQPTPCKTHHRRRSTSRRSYGIPPLSPMNSPSHSPSITTSPPRPPKAASPSMAASILQTPGRPSVAKVPLFSPHALTMAKSPLTTSHSVLSPRVPSALGPPATPLSAIPTPSKQGFSKRLPPPYLVSIPAPLDLSNF